MAHAGPCRAPRSRRKGLGFDHVFKIHNETLDGFGIVLAMWPPIVLRSAIQKDLHTCNRTIDVKTPSGKTVRFPSWMLRSLTPEEDGPLRNAVRECLEKIAAGERHPHKLRLVFERWFSRTTSPQTTPRTMIHACGHRGVRFSIGLSEIVFDEIVRLAKSDLRLVRCDLKGCRHFFIGDPGTEFCHKTCVNRSNYLQRTDVQTVQTRKLPASRKTV